MYKSKINDRRKTAALSFLVIGIIIRTVFFIVNLRLGGVDIDEAMLANNANSLVNNGTDVLGNRYPVYFPTWFYGGQSPAATYMSALFIALFGNSLFALRLPIFLISILGFACCIGLGAQLFENNVRNEFIFDAVCTVSPWMIFSGTFVLDCNYMGYNLMFALYFFIKAYKSKRMSLFGLSMLFFSLCFYSYIAAVLFVPVFLVALYLILIIKKHIDFKTCAVSVASVTVFSSLFIIFGLVLIKAVKPFELGIVSFPDMENYARSSSLSLNVSSIRSWLNNLRDTCTKLIFVDLSYIYIPKLSFQYSNLLGGIFGLIGIAALGIKKLTHKKIGLSPLTKYITFASLIAFVIYCLSVNSYVAYRCNIFSVFLLLFEAVGIGEIFDAAKKINTKRAKQIVSVYLAMSFVFFSAESAIYAQKKNDCQGLLFLDSFCDSLKYCEDNEAEKINIIVNYDSYGVIDGGVDVSLRYYYGSDKLYNYYDNMMLWYAKSIDEKKHSYPSGAFSDNVEKYRDEHIGVVNENGVRESDRITVYSTSDSPKLSDDFYIVDRRALPQTDSDGYENISFGAFSVLKRIH